MPCSHSEPSEHSHQPAGDPAPRRPWPAAARFLGWFLGFSGLYAMGAVCPFCGRPGCPTGAASAGLVGLVFAALTQWGRSLRAFWARLARR
jgi:hypothetical protein